MMCDTPFHAGVFIGGMEGVIEEFALFREVHPTAKIWPIASTGAATLDIYASLDGPRPEIFLREMTYQTLFRQMVGELRS
jgi:SLOG cluster3 family